MNFGPEGFADAGPGLNREPATEFDLEVPHEIAALPGLTVSPGLWRRRCVELWGELFASASAEDIDRRHQFTTYARLVHDSALSGRVRPERWSICGTLRCTPHGPLLHSVTKRKTAAGRSLRDAIIAPPGHKLLVADMRSSHWWLIAGITGDGAILEALERGALYDEVAGLLGVTRSAAKLVLLALANGGGRPALSKALGCRPEQALGAIAPLHARFPGIRQMPKGREWETPLLGRRVVVPAHKGEHVVIGWRCQSYEADVVVVALRALAHRTVVHQAHDELVIEVPDDEIEDATNEVALVLDEAMRKAAGLGPGDPFATVEVSVDETWSGAAHEDVRDPGGPLELPRGPVRDGPWSGREALQQALDVSAAAEKADGRREALAGLLTSPWLPRFADHEDLLLRLPSRAAGPLKSASKKAAKEEEERRARDAAHVREQRQAEHEEELRKMRAAEPPPPDPPPAEAADETPDKPQIVLGPFVDLLEEETIRALAKVPGVFSRGRRLVHVVPDEHGEIEIVSLEATTISNRMSRGAVFLAKLPENERPSPMCVQLDGGEWFRPVKPPMYLAHMVHDAGDYPGVPALAGFSRLPVLRPDGTVAVEPGWDPVTRYLYVPKGRPPQIPDKPTRDDAVAALKRLANVTKETPFARPSDAAAARALALTLAGRSVIAGCTPCFVASANQPRVGKTFLLQLLGLIGTGSWVGPTDWPMHREERTDVAELRKVIDADRLAGTPFVIYDNVRAVIAGTTLESVTTSTFWKCRVLGRSVTLTVPNRTVDAITLNGLAVGGDMFGRIQPIMLDYPEHGPENRSFETPNLKSLVEKHQVALNAAAITVLSAYLQAGAPDQGLTTWNSFNEWSALVRGALVWAGDVDPYDARDGLSSADDSKSAVDRLIAFIDKVVCKAEWTAGHIADEMERGHASDDQTNIGGGWTPKDARLLASEWRVLKDGAVDRRAFGWRIRGLVGRPDTDGVRICKVMVEKDGKREQKMDRTKVPIFALERPKGRGVL